LLIVRQETIKLNEEIQKLRDQLRELLAIYHREWLELQRLDDLYNEKAARNHGDEIANKRRELRNLLDGINRIMQAVPY